VSVDGVTSDELRALYAGKARTFQSGASAVVLLRDRGESANAVLAAAVPGLLVSREPGGDERQLRVLYHDASMLEALASTPGGLGVSALGLAREMGPAVKVLDLDGVKPSLASLEDGTWPVRRTLAVVARPERLERARAFLDFVFSDEGAAVIRAAYALPVATR
jgi:phosphate transport system substrate-binding protein